MNQLLISFILLTTAVSVQSLLLDKNQVNPYIANNIGQKLNSTMQNLHDALIKNSMKLPEIRVKFLLNLENDFNNFTKKINTQRIYNDKNKMYDQCTNSALKKIFKTYNHIRNETRQVFNSKVNEIENALSLAIQMPNKQLLKFHPEIKNCTTEENRGTLTCIFYQTNMAKSDIKKTIKCINNVNSLGNKLSKQLEDSNIEYSNEFFNLSNIVTNNIELCLKKKQSFEGIKYY